MKKKVCSSAVLFLVYNRPQPTRKVFEAIRKAAPKRLYIAADGPKDGNPADHVKVNEVRSILAGVDWDCELKTLLRDRNLGCKAAVSSALDWFFENEEEGIILEDDCLPIDSFFPFCEELLKKHRKDKRVMMISGTTFCAPREGFPYSYYYSRYHHIWGWASWRRAWKRYDLAMRDWPRVRNSGVFEKIMTRKVYSKELEKKQFLCWRKFFDRAYIDKTIPWDCPWILSCWLYNGLTIVPRVNMVSNIGFGRDAEHTCCEGVEVSALRTSRMAFPLKHPPAYFQDKKADMVIEKAFLKMIKSII